MRDKKKEGSHNTCQSLVCAACGEKNLRCTYVTDPIACQLRDVFYSSYDSSVSSYPTGICPRCRKNLHIAKTKGSKAVPQSVREKWKIDYGTFKAPPWSAPCNCRLYNIVKFSTVNLRQKDQPSLPRKEEEEEEEEEEETNEESKDEQKGERSVEDGKLDTNTAEACAAEDMQVVEPTYKQSLTFTLLGSGPFIDNGRFF